MPRTKRACRGRVSSKDGGGARDDDRPEFTAADYDELFGGESDDDFDGFDS